MLFNAARESVQGALEAAAADARHQAGCSPKFMCRLVLTRLAEAQHDGQALRFGGLWRRRHGHEFNSITPVTGGARYQGTGAVPIVPGPDNRSSPAGQAKKSAMRCPTRAGDKIASVT